MDLMNLRSSRFQRSGHSRLTISGYKARDADAKDCDPQCSQHHAAISSPTTSNTRAAPFSPDREQNGVRAILRLYGRKVQGGALPKEV